MALLAVGVFMLSGLALNQGDGESSASAGAAPSVSAPSATPSVAPDVIRVAALGDSVTQANSPDFSAGKIGDGSWMHYVLGDGIVFAGGWAQGGVQTSAMVENVTPYPDVDVLVLLTGSNDYVNDVPFSTTTANFDAIVATVDPAQVLVSSVPPLDRDPESAEAFNAELHDLAEARGWSFVDGAADAHDADGKYLSGFTLDGIHPTPAAAKTLGASVRSAVLALP